MFSSQFKRINSQDTLRITFPDESYLFEPKLAFTMDFPLVSGSDGCNAIDTTWTVEGDEITIEPFATTQKACPGDQWLSKASTATIDGEVMTFKDDQGSVIGGLEKEK